MTDLLIIRCSRTKKHLENVPAIELYDGQAYRVINILKDEFVYGCSADLAYIHPEVFLRTDY